MGSKKHWTPYRERMQHDGNRQVLLERLSGRDVGLYRYLGLSGVQRVLTLAGQVGAEGNEGRKVLPTCSLMSHA